MQNHLSQAINRRTFLSQAGFGLGATALSSALAHDSFAAESPSMGLAGLPHLPPKVKRVIFLCMAGGPSQFETFDNKPELSRRDRKSVV